MAEILALIPARGGSKSIPFKNLVPLAGLPLLAYSIRAGQNSRLIPRVVVSTDSARIREVALAHAPRRPSCARPSWPGTTPPTCRSFSTRSTGWPSTRATAPTWWCSCAPPAP